MGVLWAVLGWILGQVTGYLTEGNEPIIGAQVWWSSTKEGALTDSMGKFVLQSPLRWPAALRCDRTQDSLVIEAPPTQPLVWDIAGRTQLPTQHIHAEAPAVSLPVREPQALQIWGRNALTAAPCCNLSEAFEGTALVDATLSDGSLGVRQLRLLGFEPAHSPIFYENKPLSLGLYRPWAAHFLPALWVQSLALAKGIGSVRTGFDGAAGQIQTQYLALSSEYSRTVELFARSTGEFFVASRWQLQTHPKHTWLLLTNFGGTPFQSPFLQDHNGDGFLDIPLFRHGHALLKHAQKDSAGGLFEVDAEALLDTRWGGAVDFRRPADLTLGLWGSYQRLGFTQVSLRRGWVFSQGRGLSLLAQGRFFRQQLQAGWNSYTASQPLGWLQLIYQQPIGDSRWMLQTGLTAQAASYAESLQTWHGYDTAWKRPEYIPGAFAELTYTPHPTLSAVLGGRVDWHSYWGWQAVPRLHLRWQYAPTGVLRLSGGRSWRIPDPIAESFAFLASSRQWRLTFPGWPAVESAWSYGFFAQHSWPFAQGVLRLSVDGVQAHIQKPLLWDIERSWQIQVTSSERPAQYQTIYAELSYELPDRLRVQLSYKHQEVWWPLSGGYRLRPLLPRDRVVGWITWMTLSRRWQIDAICSWVGSQRLPSTAEKPAPYLLSTRTPAYTLLTLQLTHRIDQWELQLAAENLNGFRQAWPVLAPEAPFSPYFDASLIWGPIMGRMVSLTVRYSW